MTIPSLYLLASKIVFVSFSYPKTLKNMCIAMKKVYQEYSKISEFTYMHTRVIMHIISWRLKLVNNTKWHAWTLFLFCNNNPISYYSSCYLLLLLAITSHIFLHWKIIKFHGTKFCSYWGHSVIKSSWWWWS